MKKGIAYSVYLEERDKRKKTNAVSLGLLLTGFILAGPFSLKAFVSTGMKETAYALISVIGFILIVLGTVIPQRLMRFYDGYLSLINTVGKYVLRILIIPIYGILLILAVFFKKKMAQHYYFNSWIGSVDNPPSAFETDRENQYDGSPSGFLHTLNQVFAAYTRNDQFFLLPIVFLLILIGMIFFFVSTSSVFGFIYTLF